MKYPTGPFKKRYNDPRITRKQNIWKDFLINFILLTCLSVSQLLIFNEYSPISFVSPGQLWAFVSYWMMIAVTIAFITSGIRYRRFQRPMQNLSRAAGKVAAGDFSVYVDNKSRGIKKDYIDVLFDDFNTMIKELGSTQTMKNDFIANVSHELKTPLATIQNYSVALKDPSLPEKTRNEYIETIITASERLSGLITNILKLNKLENDTIRPEPESFDLCRNLMDCALAFEPVWGAKKINFKVDVEDRAIIKADSGLLNLVWNNLLSNAFKFTPSGGEVSLRQISDEKTVTIMVSDNGIGMTPGTINHIFDKFYQGETSHSGEGNGLGLALAKRAVDLCGGKIDVKSSPNKGSAFIITLPV